MLTHLRDASARVLRMQRAMELMNIKVHDVIRDITGASGRRGVRAILDGERNPARLLEPCEAIRAGRKEEANPRGRIGGRKMGKNAPKILGLDSVLSTVPGGRRPAKIPGLTPCTTLTLV